MRILGSSLWCVRATVTEIRWWIMQYSIVTEDQNGKIVELGDFEEAVHPFAADPKLPLLPCELERISAKRGRAEAEDSPLWRRRERI